jgi:poly(hydroxyalkanoate) depolymerase family esterase
MRWNQLFRKPVFFLTVLFILLSSVAEGAEEAEITTDPAITKIENFGPNPGNLSMYEYVPEYIAENKLALVVALHGCNGSAKQFSKAGFNELAEKYGFIVLYPEQKTANNNIRCFNHSRPHMAEAREREAESVLQMVRYMIAEHGISKKHVFIAGFSSGGQFANILAASYPETFRAAAIIGAGGYVCKPGHAGIREFVDCEDEEDEQDEALLNIPGKPLRWPKISIWHGKKDKNVPYKTMELAVEQWKFAHKIRRKRRHKKKLPGDILYQSYKTSRGHVMIESYSMNSRAHTVPVTENCGVPGGDFSLAKICFARRAVQFFGIR